MSYSTIVPFSLPRAIRPCLDAPTIVFAKGDWVVSRDPDKHAEGDIVAIARDGSVKVRIYSDRAVWLSANEAQARLRVIDPSSRELDCHKCGGSGIFYGGGSVVNGVYKGYSGPCYPCDGHGKQTVSDRFRNRTYWAKYARLSA